MLKVEDGVPIPTPRLSLQVLGYERLEVGQSILITTATHEQVGASIRSFRRSRKGFFASRKFTTRKVEEFDADGKSLRGIRVWRIE